MSKRFRTIIGVMVASAVVFTLSACGVGQTYTNQPRAGGQSIEATEAQLEAIPGIEKAEFRTQEWKDRAQGLPEAFDKYGMNIALSVTIKPEFHIDNPRDFLEFIGAVAWSTNSLSPQGSVKLFIEGGIDPNYDWRDDVKMTFGATANEIGTYEKSSYNPDDFFEGEGKSVIYLEDKFYIKKFGAWVGDPVETPGSLLSVGAPDSRDANAIRSVFVSTSKHQKDGVETACFNLLAERGKNGDISYEGEVNIVFYLDGKEEARRVIPAAVEPFASTDVCYKGTVLPSGTPSVRFTTTPQEGFNDIDAVYDKSGEVIG